jgi:hypothetical protein
VTDLAAHGDDPGKGSTISVEALFARRSYAHPFIEFNRRRGRSSACTSLVGLAWSFDPPATTQHADRLGAYSFDQKSLDA